jgi:hypothetical protein
MAATNKCLAQNDKSRHVRRATKDTNGHRPSVLRQGSQMLGILLLVASLLFPALAAAESLQIEAIAPSKAATHGETLHEP